MATTGRFFFFLGRDGKLASIGHGALGDSGSIGVFNSGNGGVLSQRITGH